MEKSVDKIFVHECKRGPTSLATTLHRIFSGNLEKAEVSWYYVWINLFTKEVCVKETIQVFKFNKTEKTTLSILTIFLCKRTHLKEPPLLKQNDGWREVEQVTGSCVLTVCNFKQMLNHETKHRILLLKTQSLIVQSIVTAVDVQKHLTTNGNVLLHSCSNYFFPWYKSRTRLSVFV